MEMERNLSKFLTLEEAAKEGFLTASMIELLCVWNRIPYFRDIEQYLVNPEDVKQFLAKHWEDMVTIGYTKTGELKPPHP